MQKFTEKIVNMMKSENMFEPQGGPIIMSQIENEYGPVEQQTGAPGKAYTNWFANMVVSLDTNVPWIMCKHDDAPDPIINTCNDFYYLKYSPNKQQKTNMWTELWTGWTSSVQEETKKIISALECCGGFRIKKIEFLGPMAMDGTIVRRESVIIHEHNILNKFMTFKSTFRRKSVSWWSCRNRASQETIIFKDELREAQTWIKRAREMNIGEICATFSSD